MLNKLKKLADILNGYKLYQEAILIRKLSQTFQPVSQVKEPAVKPLEIILNSLGLNLGDNQGIEFVYAALYLSEGVNEQNLLLSGLSVASLVPGLQDIGLLLTPGANVNPEDSLKIARMILQHKDRIKFSFDAMKNPAAANSIKQYVMKGEYLTKYSDRMFESVRSWALKMVNSAKSEPA